MRLFHHFNFFPVDLSGKAIPFDKAALSDLYDQSYRPVTQPVMNYDLQMMDE